MALGNWYSAAWTEKGQACTADWCLDSGINIYVYKNWLNIADDKAWRAIGGFVRPMVLRIEQGDLQYHSIFIRAVRGPQNGIYCCVTDGEQGPLGMLMCGVSRYDCETAKELNLSPSSLEWFRRKMKRWADRPWIFRDIDKILPPTP